MLITVLLIQMPNHSHIHERSPLIAMCLSIEANIGPYGILWLQLAHGTAFIQITSIDISIQCLIRCMKQLSQMITLSSTSLLDYRCFINMPLLVQNTQNYTISESTIQLIVALYGHLISQCALETVIAKSTMNGQRHFYRSTWGTLRAVAVVQYGNLCLCGFVIQVLYHSFHFYMSIVCHQVDLLLLSKLYLHDNVIDTGVTVVLLCAYL